MYVQSDVLVTELVVIRSGSGHAGSKVSCLQVLLNGAATLTAAYELRSAKTLLMLVPLKSAVGNENDATCNYSMAGCSTAQGAPEPKANPPELRSACGYSSGVAMTQGAAEVRKKKKNSIAARDGLG